MLEQGWRIELFGGLRARQGQRVFGRFRTQKTGALLSYLAYFRGRTHGRETLIEMLWPEVSEEAGRHSLSQALSSLRSQLEPPGVPAGSVIVADRISVELNPDAFTTDVGDFEHALRKATLARNTPDRESLLADAVDKYGGALLDGYFEDWITAEQERIASRFRHAALDLLSLLEKNGDAARAIEIAGRTVDIEPLNEDFRQSLMRALASSGQPGEAVRQYRDFERLLDTELGLAPQQATRELLARIEEESARESRSERRLPQVASVGRPPAPAARSTVSGFPSGTVTFLFTDIEGSTALWEHSGEVFRSALSLHHALLRAEFRRNGGVEVKEAGDSFLVAFGSALDALSCAVASQRALAAQEWPASPADGSRVAPRVRMAVHTGEVELDEIESTGDGNRPGQDYHGMVLHRASRMLSAAHGGQILCSETTAALTRRDLDPSVRLRDLGLFNLRDVQGAERLFQVDYSDPTDQTFPPLRATPARAARLPVLFTRFFGREREVQEISDLLLSDSVRLVTLTGTGGTGKTRLAIEVARRSVESTEVTSAAANSIWFVALADLKEPALITRAIADAMALPALPHVDPRAQVIEALMEGPSLLILDNFEQLVDGGAEVVLELLEEAPNLKAVVTSRLLLGLEGEREYIVAPLPTPHSSRGVVIDGSPERVSTFESVRLFIDRAQAVKPDFQVTNANAPAVAELCDRLEGIPLAIELAAARAQMMTPATMVQQLANRFDFLVSRKRGTVERQRTLRSAVDWSYRLLAPDLQHFFARLSVFRGGWTIEAAESVCEEPLALDFLAQLRDGSLVLPEECPESSSMRFRMMESLREYAEERLTPEQKDQVHHKHAEWLVDLAQRAERELLGAGERAWLERMELENANARSAIEWARNTSADCPDRSARISLGLRIAASLGRFWSIRGHAREVLPLVKSLLSVTNGGIDLRLKAGVLDTIGSLAHDMRDFTTAGEALGRNLQTWRDLGESARLANTLNLSANVALDQGNDLEAEPLYQKALSIFHETGDERGIGMALSNLSVIALQRGEDERAANLMEESLKIKRKGGSQYGLAIALENLGNLQRRLGDLGCAREHHEEALAIRREIGHKVGVAMSLNNLGHLLVDEGDIDSATVALLESIDLFKELQDGRGLSESLEGVARVLFARRQHEAGANILGASRAHASSEMAVDDVQTTLSHDWASSAREALGEKQFENALRVARAWTMEEGVERAKAHLTAD